VLDDAYNGTIRGTYTYLTAGTYAVMVEVANNATGALACDTLNGPSARNRERQRSPRRP